MDKGAEEREFIEEEWERAGWFGELLDEAYAWFEHGFSPEEALEWFDLMFSAEEAAEWRKLGSPREASEWISAGWKHPEVASEWRKVTSDPVKALEMFWKLGVAEHRLRGSRWVVVDKIYLPEEEAKKLGLEKPELERGELILDLDWSAVPLWNAKEGRVYLYLERCLDENEVYKALSPFSLPVPHQEAWEAWTWILHSRIAGGEEAESIFRSAVDVDGRICARASGKRWEFWGEAGRLRFDLSDLMNSEDVALSP